MSDQSKKFLSSVMFWKLGIFKGANGWFMAASMAFLGFTDSDPQFKTPTWIHVRLFVFCFAAGSKFLDGFVDQTLQNLRDAYAQKVDDDNSSLRAFVRPQAPPPNPPA